MVVNSMSYATYDSYKDSGVDWLGAIPSDWELGRISAFFSERRQKVSDKDYPALSVTKLGVFPQWENVAKSNDGDNRKLVKKGDFVINSRSDRKGSSGIAKQDGSVSLINIVLKPVNIEPRYSEYLFKSYNFIEEFYRVGHGIVADLWTTRFDDIKNSMIALPTFDEQVKIANFLDQKTAQIDQAIALKQQQIEKLNEYKQIVIQNAVTKGLNPNVKMKNSGVEWIGDIPEHWEITATKRLLEIPITDGPHTTPLFYDEGILFISAESIKNGKINFDKKRGYISKADYDLYSKKYKPKRNDIYMVKSEATTGRVAMVETDEIFTIWSPLAVFRTKNNVLLPKFLFYYLQSSSFQKSIELAWSYGTQQNIGMGVLGNLQCIIPPLAEQEKIIDFIEPYFSKFDKTKQLYQTQIDRLKEYKNILINQAVTGKIKI